MLLRKYFLFLISLAALWAETGPVFARSAASGRLQGHPGLIRRYLQEKQRFGTGVCFRSYKQHSARFYASLGKGAVLPERYYRVFPGRGAARLAASMRDNHLEGFYLFSRRGGKLHAIDHFHTAGKVLLHSRTVLRAGEPDITKGYLMGTGKPRLSFIRLYVPDGYYLITRLGHDTAFWPSPASDLGRQARTKEKELGLTRGSLIPFRVGKSIVYMEKFFKPGLDFTFLHVHTNELTAYFGLKHFINRHGGKGFLFLGPAHKNVHKRTRRFPFQLNGKEYYLDLNRIFCDDFLRRHFYLVGRLYGYSHNTYAEFDAHEKEIRREIRKLRDFVLYLFLVQEKPAVVVHDNHTPIGWAEAIFRGYASKTARRAWYKPGSSYRNFFYVTEARDFTFLKQAGYNVMLQDNDRVKDDGSASVAFAKKGKRYVSIEVERDTNKSQKSFHYLQGMLQTLVRCFRQ